MLVIPIQSSQNEFDIFVVLEDLNIERIKAYDPAELRVGALPPIWQRLKVKTITLLYATKEEVEDLKATNDEKALTSVLSHLSRGFQYRPDKGDYDGPYRKGRI